MHLGELYARVGFIVTSMSRPAENVVAFYNMRGRFRPLRRASTNDRHVAASAGRINGAEGSKPGSLDSN
jgi:hypothetical protein